MDACKQSCHVVFSNNVNNRTYLNYNQLHKNNLFFCDLENNAEIINGNTFVRNCFHTLNVICNILLSAIIISGLTHTILTITNICLYNT